MEILEATVAELSDDVNVAEDLIDVLQIDVSVINSDVTGKSQSLFSFRYHLLFLFDTFLGVLLAK